MSSGPNSGEPVREVWSRATNIVLVLFAGLIVSSLGLVAKLHTYKAAISSTQNAKNKNALSNKVEANINALVGTRVTGRLKRRLAIIPQCQKMREAALQKPQAVPPRALQPRSGAIPRTAGDAEVDFEENFPDCD